jgi:AcrR family transcriptional regulator
VGDARRACADGGGSRGVPPTTGPSREAVREQPATRGPLRTRAAEATSAGCAVERDSIKELQRARIIAAMSELVHERGVGSVTVAHVVARSGVSRRTFYEQFDDREGCLFAAFEGALARAAAVVLPAYEIPGAWAEQIRAALAALLGFLDDEPALGGLLIVTALAAEGRVLERRARVLDALVDAVHRDARAVDRERAQTRSRRARSVARPRRIVAEGAVGAVLAVIHARLVARGSQPLSGLLNPLMGMLVLPYLGASAAARELVRPAPRARRPSAASADPLRSLDMRLTYRTVRVLLAIAERPGANGRQVADASGISDQGQMSKLLARLRQLGLIHNAAPGHRKGEPNVWSLTSRGGEVERAIRVQSNH